MIVIPHLHLARVGPSTQLTTWFLPVIRNGAAARVRAASGAGSPKPKQSGVIDIIVAHGVDIEKLRRRNSSALQYPPARIMKTIAALKVIGVHPAKALDRWPILWSVDPSCWGERLDVLRDLDLDVAKIVTASPSVLSHPSETLRLKMAALSQMGLHAAKVVKNCPSVFSLHDERIRRTIVFLDGVGLDGLFIINRVPAVLHFNVDTKLRPVVHFVTITMGRRVTALNTAPASFCYSLNGRMMPRYEFAVLHQKQHLSLSTLFGTTDTCFAKCIGQPITAYCAFVTQRMRE